MHSQIYPSAVTTLSVIDSAPMLLEALEATLALLQESPPFAVYAQARAAIDAARLDQRRAEALAHDAILQREFDDAVYSGL